MINDKPIMLWVTTTLSKDGEVHCFHPALPTVMSVCKQMRAETPLKRYYAINTFLFSDSMFQPNMLSAFRAIRGPSIDAMTRIKIFHHPRVCVDYGPTGFQMTPHACQGYTEFEFTVRFTATLTAKRSVKVTDLVACAPLGWRDRTPDAGDGICFCFIGDIVDSISQQDQPGGELFRLLVEYLHAVDKMGVYGRASVCCAKCGGIQGLKDI